MLGRIEPRELSLRAQLEWVGSLRPQRNRPNASGGVKDIGEFKADFAGALTIGTVADFDRMAHSQYGARGAALTQVVNDAAVWAQGRSPHITDADIGRSINVVGTNAPGAPPNLRIDVGTWATAQDLEQALTNYLSTPDGANPANAKLAREALALLGSASRAFETETPLERAR